MVQDREDWWICWNAPKVTLPSLDCLLDESHWESRDRQEAWGYRGQSAEEVWSLWHQCKKLQQANQVAAGLAKLTWLNGLPNHPWPYRSPDSIPDF
jgi:hypothetical protein